MDLNRVLAKEINFRLRFTTMSITNFPLTTARNKKWKIVKSDGLDRSIVYDHVSLRAVIEQLTTWGLLDPVSEKRE